jgi:ubiquitin-activating enzyme E1
MGDCITWARFLFEELFVNSIKQLLHNFPADKLTSAGVPFWSGSKKPPSPLVFSREDPLHISFIVSVANLRAEMFGIAPDPSRDLLIETLENLTLPKFV